MGHPIFVAARTGNLSELAPLVKSYRAAWKKAGFRPVVLSSTDLIPSLTSGMVDIIAQPPLYAFTTHIFEKAPNMLNMHWGFLTGATVVKRDVWQKIPDAVRKKLLALGEEYGEKTRKDVRKQND